ncbi:hypothetical protein [Methylobacterium sp. 10]|uniref:MotE family protein n=1 Tax=Methylobacterium sp. 10 TaxID=1101191 RepID=UPI000486E2BB|nr:hypothetical protein [Methylobacterium sp. 10]
MTTPGSLVRAGHARLGKLRTGRPGAAQARPYKLRLIDAVTLAAVGLLVLKLGAIAVDDLGPSPASAEAQLPDFARVLAKARTNYELPDPQTTGSVTPKEPEKPAAEPEPPAPRPPPPAEPMPASERAILEKLSARRDALRQRDETLSLREQMLGTAERKLEEGVKDLKRNEDRPDGAGAQQAEAERTGLKNIVTMYETMKPKDAARVFDRLSLDVLVPIVLAMNPRKMADVLALMQSEPAEKLTVALANRARGQTPTQQPVVMGLGPNELPAIDQGGQDKRR